MFPPVLIEGLLLLTLQGLGIVVLIHTVLEYSKEKQCQRGDWLQSRVRSHNCLFGKYSQIEKESQSQFKKTDQEWGSKQWAIDLS